MNTHLKQLWAAMKLPEKLQKSYKFFCRGLDIRVPQAVEVYRREIMGSEEPREPRCYHLGVDGCTVPFGE